MALTMLEPAGTAAPGTPAIELAHVERTYGKGDSEVHALQRVSLAVAEGEFIAIMGPSGSRQVDVAQPGRRPRSPVGRQDPGQRPRHRWAQCPRGGALPAPRGGLRVPVLQPSAVAYDAREC